MRKFHTPISKYNKPFKNLCIKCTICTRKGGFYCANYIFYYIEGVLCCFFLNFMLFISPPQKITSHILFYPKKMNYVHKTLFIIVCMSHAIFYTLYQKTCYLLFSPPHRFCIPDYRQSERKPKKNEKRAQKISFSDPFLHYIF